MNLLPPPPPVILVLPAPVPASRARSRGAVRFHDPKEPYAIWRAAAAVALVRQWQRPPIVGPVEVSCAFIFPRPETKPAWCPAAVWASEARFRRAVGADRDNLDKAVLDAIQVPAKPPSKGMPSLRNVNPASLVGFVIRDDSAVVAGGVEKWVASVTETPRTLVRVRSIGWTE